MRISLTVTSLFGRMKTNSIKKGLKNGSLFDIYQLKKAPTFITQFTQNKCITFSKRVE